MINMSDPNFWVISGLFFLLGLLVGMWMTAGGRRKWRGRYKDEATRREGLEDELHRCREEWDVKEKEWRERDSLRDAAIKDRRDPNQDRRSGERRVADEESRIEERRVADRRSDDPPL